MKFSDFKIGSRLYASIGAVVLLFVGVIFSIFINFSNLGEASKWNIHTYEVAAELDAILTSLINMETGERGFAMTGMASSLDPYKDGLKAFDKHVAAAKQLTADNSAQQQRLQKLVELQRHWISQALEPVIVARRQAIQSTERINEVIVMVPAGKGKADMDAMRVIMAEAKEHEMSLLVQRSKEMADLQSATAIIEPVRFSVWIGVMK